VVLRKTRGLNVTSEDIQDHIGHSDSGYLYNRYTVAYGAVLAWRTQMGHVTENESM
jgi:hypothetical protein